MFAMMNPFFINCSWTISKTYAECMLLGLLWKYTSVPYLFPIWNLKNLNYMVLLSGPDGSEYSPYRHIHIYNKTPWGLWDFWIMF